MRVLQQFNAFAEKRIAFITPLCLVIGILFSGWLSGGVWAVPFVFAFMTFCGGLSSGFREVRDILFHPLPLMAAFCATHILLPLFAFCLGSMLFPGQPDYLTGMVLEAASPTAVVSFMWVAIVRGNSSLTLSFILLDTVLSPFSVPLTLRVLMGSNVHMDPLGMIRDLFWMIAVPALGAMLMNQFTSGWARKSLLPVLAPFSKMALIFVVLVNSTRISDAIRHFNWFLGGITAVIFLIAVCGYCFGWLMAGLSGQKPENAISMTFGSGIKNINSGAVIAAAYFPAETMFPVIIATLFQQVLAAVFSQLLIKRYGSVEERERAASAEQ